MLEVVELLEELEGRDELDVVDEELGVEDELEDEGVLEDERLVEELCAPGVAKKKKLTPKIAKTATAASPTFLEFKH